MKYAFILGKNDQLSTVELFSVLKSSKIDYQVNFHSNRILILDIDSDIFLPSDFIEKVGGIVRIVRIYNIENYFDPEIFTSLDIFYANSFNYGFIDLNLSKDEELEVRESIKSFFKKNKFKAYLKNSDYSSKDNVTDPAKYFSWKLDSGFEFFIAKFSNYYYYGITEACTNAKKYIFLDESRPQRIFTHGTSFRLAQIMLNILRLEPGSTFVDPFSGTGTFMIQAMMNNMNAIGIDIDDQIIFAAKKNINWAKNEFKFNQKHMMIHESSETAKFSADGSAFEPYMGPFLKDLPRFVDAEDTVYMLDKIYTNLFKNLAKNLKQREEGLPSIVCILPEFKTREGKLLKPDYNKMLSSAGFKLMNLKNIDSSINAINPILYQTPEGNNIVRKVYVLVRNP